MKNLDSRYRTAFGMSAAVGISMLTGLLWRNIIVPCDYIAQAGLILLMFILPFVADLETGFIFTRHSTWMFLITLSWGVWRMFYFDLVTWNDIPGIGYLIMPFISVLIAGSVFVIRRIVVGFF